MKRRKGGTYGPDFIVCPYCGGMAPKVTGYVMYPSRPELAHKKFYRCVPCDASCGTHPDGRPLGRLANKELRKARNYVHGLFDPIWKASDNPYARTKAYGWLADKLGIPMAACHVGMFDVEMCRKAYRVVRDAGRRGENPLEHVRVSAGTGGRVHSPSVDHAAREESTDAQVRGERQAQADAASLPGSVDEALPVRHAGDRPEAERRASDPTRC